MAKKIRKKDKNVLKWMFTVCKKQVPLMILLVVLNAIYGVSSVFFAKFSKNIICTLYARFGSISNGFEYY